LEFIFECVQNLSDLNSLNVWCMVLGKLSINQPTYTLISLMFNYQHKWKMWEDQNYIKIMEENHFMQMIFFKNIIRKNPKFHFF